MKKLSALVGMCVVGLITASQAQAGIVLITGSIVFASVSKAPTGVRLGVGIGGAVLGGGSLVSSFVSKVLGREDDATVYLVLDGDASQTHGEGFHQLVSSLVPGVSSHDRELLSTALSERAVAALAESELYEGSRVEIGLDRDFVERILEPYRDGMEGSAFEKAKSVLVSQSG
jgi:hypothetical protein